MPQANDIITMDLTGLACPIPILKARERTRKLPSGTKVALLTTDPTAINDVVHFCRKNGHQLLSQTQDSSQKPPQDASQDVSQVSAPCAGYPQVTTHVICVHAAQPT